MTTKEKVYEAIHEQERQGDVYQQQEAIVARCRAAYHLRTKTILSALAELSADGALLHLDTYYAVTATAYNERYLGSHVAGYIGNNAPYDPFDAESAVRRSEGITGLHLSDSQRRAATGALQNRLSIITGGPGTGKTTSLQVLYDAYRHQAEKEVVLLAPTGKAARRMAEQIGQDACTVHSALYTGRHQVRRYADKEWSPGLIIVDEASMLSINLLADLFRSISPRTRIVLVGDPDQLPAVGPGQVLADLISSGLPTYRLTDNFRQVSGGALAAAVPLIRDGAADLPFDGGELICRETLTPADTEMFVLSLYTSYCASGKKAQILTPVGAAGGPCSTAAINPLVQALVNPSSEQKPEVMIGKTLYRVGDRVIQKHNNAWGKNGDVGTVVGISGQNPAQLTIKLDHGDSVTYAADAAAKEDLLSLAYAITVHRAQGSEYDYVLIPMVPQHGHMWTRNMLYTAASRARQGLVLVGDKEILAQAIQTPQPVRNTHLLAEIHHPSPTAA